MEVDPFAAETMTVDKEEPKLFGKWVYEGLEVSDLCLVVRLPTRRQKIAKSYFVRRALLTETTTRDVAMC